MIREMQSGEQALVADLRVAAYRALGVLSEATDYAETLRRFGFDGDCVVLVAADETGAISGTVTLETFGPGSELARDETEADVRAFAVSTAAQGRGVGRELLRALIQLADKNGVRRLRLCTLPPMKAAQHLYEAAGFTRTPNLDWEPAPGIALQAYELAIAPGV